MDKKKKKKNKDRQFFKKNNNPNLPILYKITLRIAISSQFRQSGQWSGQFFSQFLFEKKYDRRIWVKGNNQMYLAFYRKCIRLQPLPG